MPRLFDRLRGKSGEDLLNEVKSAFDTDRRMFFDRPAWSNRQAPFPRGFPFNEEESGPQRRDLWDFDSFGDRRPADSTTGFEDPAWEEEHRRKRPRSPAERSQSSQQPGPAQAQARQPSSGPSQASKPPPGPSHGLNQHGLRNTVPLAQSQEAPNDEPQRIRAMSAPPGDRPQRFVSSCEIPLNKPQQGRNTPTPPPPPQQQQQQHGGNVRVIPIQVEGRDEPLVNSNIDTSSNFASEKPQFEGRLPRDFGPYRQHSTRFAPQSPPPLHKQPPKAPSQPQQQPPKAPTQPQQQPPPPPPPLTKQKKQSVDEPDHAPAPPLDPAAIALARVAAVQKEVNALALKVEAATPTTRSDKEYVYLDEMLTRELLKLDNIDTAGQDNIRQARKEAIRSIQNCISILESKVPGEAMEVEAVEAAANAEQPFEGVRDEPMQEVAPEPSVEQQEVTSTTPPFTAEPSKQSTATPADPPA